MSAPHPKEHPLAGRFVVTNSGLAVGDQVYVIDWIDRCPGLAGLARRGACDGPDAVLVRDGLSAVLVPAEDLPAYDPVPVGVVS